MIRLRRIVATGFGAGHAPLAPGTAGSLVGVLLFWALHAAGGAQAAALGLVAVVGLGFWSCAIAEACFGAPDPRAVVIDEIAGQMLALSFLPVTPLVLASGFLLFRLLDIVKPFPARRLEALPGGAGIMADDLIAAVYANLLLQALTRVAPGWTAGVV